MAEARTAETCRVAALQLCAGADVERNLGRCEHLLQAAAADGCRLAVLPENFAFFGARDEDKLAVTEAEGDGPIQRFLADAARRHGLAIVAGGMPLATADPRRAYNACLLLDREGRTRAVYRKMHLFDVALPQRDEQYRESDYSAAGSDVVCATTEAGMLGLTICYDLRFPELYRRLADAGASVFSVPAAFTEATGRDHWEVLLRARAIENLAWVIAAAQYGRHPSGRSTWGHTMIVDPWGRIVDRLETGDGIVVADIVQAHGRELRQRFPVLAHRRLRD